MFRLVPGIVVAAVVSLPLSFLHAQSPIDTIYYDGSILTGQSLSSVPERVTALAIHDGVIVAIGSDDTVLKLKSAHYAARRSQGRIRHARLQRCPCAPWRRRPAETFR